MGDFNSSLPVRTQNNGDVVMFLADGTTPTQLGHVDSHGSVYTVLANASGTATTSQANGSQQALDVGINVAGVQVDPRAIRALTSADVVTAVQGAAGAAAWLVKDTNEGPVTPGTVATNSGLIGGQYNSSLPTLTTGQQSAIQVDSSGRLLVNVAASAGTINTSDAADGPVTPGTVATKSILVGVQYNSSLPTLTTGQQSAIQADSSGRILVGSIASALPAGSNNIGSVNQGTSPWVTSDLADGSATGGTAGTKSLLSGGIYNSTAPTLTTGQQAGLQLDAAGNLKVTVVNSVIGSNVNKYNTTVNVAANATANHVYTITASKTFTGKKFWASASGKIRADVQTSPDGSTYSTFWTGFNSTSDPNISVDLDLLNITDSGTGSTIRIVITNRDLAAFDVFSTISGVEN